MVKYSRAVKGDQKAAKARVSHLRVSFKNTRETVRAIRGYTLRNAQRYLKDVIAGKDIVPFTKFARGLGRNTQAKKYGTNMGRWPVKVCKHLLTLLRNAEANADAKSIDPTSLVVSHIQVNAAPKMRRRMYRAHGRINPFQSSPSHVQVILTQKAASVAKGEGSVKKVKAGKLAAGTSA